MPEANPGLMGSLKRLLSTLLSIATTRLELLANELQEERLRLAQMLLFALLALFCFSVAVLLLAMFVIVLFWDEHRLAVLAGLSALFFLSGTLVAVLLRSKARAGSGLFSASLAELAKDSEQLERGDG